MVYQGFPIGLSSFNLSKMRKNRDFFFLLLNSHLGLLGIKPEGIVTAPINEILSLKEDSVLWPMDRKQRKV